MPVAVVSVKTALPNCSSARCVEQKLTDLQLTPRDISGTSSSLLTSLYLIKL